MIIYFIIFVFSFLCSAIAEKIEKQKSVEFYLFSFLTILVPSLFAGFRDTTVGIDIQTYVIDSFNTAKSSNSFIDYSSASSLEPLYLAYTYLITRFTNNLFWHLFIQQLFILSLVYSFAVSFRKKISMSLFWLIYLLFFFNESLNIVRQSFSVAIVIYSFRFLFERRILLHYICILIAIAFHYPSIILLILYPMYWSLYKTRKIYIKLILVIILISGWYIYFYFDEILSYLLSEELISRRYTGYVGKGSTIHKTDFVLSVFIWIISLATSFVAKIKYKIHGNNSFTVYTIIAIITLLCGVYNDVVHRIVLYIFFMEFIMLLMYLHSLNLNIKRRFYIYLPLIIFLFIRFVHFSLSDNALSGTIPYTSIRLGIL